MKKIILFLNLVLLVGIFAQSSAYAYIDPGTGSMLLSALVAAIAAAGATILMYWSKVKSFFLKKKKMISILMIDGF